MQGVEIGKLILDAISRIIQLVHSALDGNDEDIKRVSEILSPQSKMKLEQLRAERLANEKFGESP